MTRPVFVHKYGGTSVGSTERIEAIAGTLIAVRKRGHSPVVVVSAMGNETDRLASLGAQVAQNATLQTREMDALLASGEQASAALLALCLTQKGQAARSFTGWQAGIHTDAVHGRARITHIDTKTLHDCLSEGGIPVVAGFQGVSSEGDITTLGRGGSDTTAIALAVALKAEECFIHTDVDGVYTADPRIVEKARLLPEITLEEMLELASLGSQILHSRAVEMAGKHDVPMRVLSSFREGQGTLVTKDPNNEEEALAMEQIKISGVTCTADEAKITLQQVKDKPGIAAHILGLIADKHIDVDMIVQNVADNGLTDFTFTVKRQGYQAALKALQSDQIDSRGITGDDQVAKVSVVGIGMRSHSGIASQMFRALAEKNINIKMISTSEIKISVLVDKADMELAVRTLHDAFDLADDSA